MYRCPSRKIQVPSALVVLVVLMWPLSALAAEVNGVVRSGVTPIAFSPVTLYKAGTHRRNAVVLGTAQSDSNGHFTIFYKPARDSNAVLYLVADGAPQSSRGRGIGSETSPVRLATVLGTAPFPGDVVINERTTVATAYAMAQFIQGRRIGGVFPGLQNAAATVRNLVDLSTGEVGSVLDTLPNGELTSTMRAFNALANMLAACVQTPSNCAMLFEEATTPRGRTPRNTLQAMVNIAHNPGQNVQELFDLSQTQTTYQPALPNNAVSNGVINAWILAIRYQGDGPLGQELDGPGNIAFDEYGNAWVNNNYDFSLVPNPSRPICGSTKLIKLTPTGGSVPGAPFGGTDGSGVGAGGLYGAGVGIAVDPKGNVWVTNFGFQGRNCTYDATTLFVSVSKFNADGVALSPDGDPANNVPGGFLGQGNIRAPQGVVSDREGNIWLANCASNSVTRFARGNPDESMNFDAIGVEKPFYIAIDTRGHAWVTGNGTNNVVELDRNGVPIADPVTGLERPMGIASDSLGNLWVANAGVMNPPCPALLPEPEIGDDGAKNFRTAVTLIRHRGSKRQVETFGKQDGKRDGLRWPWGIAVDGNDNVWVANFAGQRLMQLCGVRERHCPPGVRTGDPVSPDAGYFSDALVRNTGVQIDPSGNVWLANNWIIEGFTVDNPGGHEVVVFIGLAAPIKTPLIGPPERPGPDDDDKDKDDDDA